MRLNEAGGGSKEVLRWKRKKGGGQELFLLYLLF